MEITTELASIDFEETNGDVPEHLLNEAESVIRECEAAYSRRVVLLHTPSRSLELVLAEIDRAGDEDIAIALLDQSHWSEMVLNGPRADRLSELEAAAAIAWRKAVIPLFAIAYDMRETVDLRSEPAFLFIDRSDRVVEDRAGDLRSFGVEPEKYFVWRYGG